MGNRGCCFNPDKANQKEIELLQESKARLKKNTDQRVKESEALQLQLEKLKQVAQGRPTEAHKNQARNLIAEKLAKDDVVENNRNRMKMYDRTIMALQEDASNQRLNDDFASLQKVLSPEKKKQLESTFKTVESVTSHLDEVNAHQDELNRYLEDKAIPVRASAQPAYNSAVEDELEKLFNNSDRFRVSDETDLSEDLPMEDFESEDQQEIELDAMDHSPSSQNTDHKKLLMFTENGYTSSSSDRRPPPAASGSMLLTAAATRNQQQSSMTREIQTHVAVPLT